MRSASAFWNMLHRQRQRRYRRDARRTEPGNQMAGFDLRWNSPDRQLAVRHLLAVHRRRRIELRAGEVHRAATAWKCGSRWRMAGCVQGFVEYSTHHLFGEHRSRPLLQLRLQPGPIQCRGLSLHGRVIGYTRRSRCRELLARRHVHDAERRDLVGHGAHVAAQSRRFRRCPQYRGLGSDRLRRARVRLARQVVWRALSRWIWASNRSSREGGERDVQPFGFVRWTHAFAP